MTPREYNAARIRAARERGDCIQCCKRPALHGVRCDDCLAYHREYRKQQYANAPRCANNPIGYTPLDETLRKPRWRVLRALLHHDWCEAAELRDVASDDCSQCGFYDACRLGTRSGEIERRKVPMRDALTGRIVHATYYRITDKGRAALASLLDGYQRALAA